MIYDTLLKASLAYILLGLAFVLPPTSLISQQFSQDTRQYDLIIHDDFKETVLSKQWVFSTNEQYDFNQVQALQQSFDPVEQSFVNRGIDYRYHWIRLSLANNSTEENYIYDFGQSYMDSVKLWVEYEDSIATFPTQGLYFPSQNFSSPFIMKRSYPFEVFIPSQSSVTIYIQATRNDGPFLVESRLYSPKAYKQRIQNIETRSGLLNVFTGFVLLASLSAITMLVLSRERLYFYYLGFILTIYLNLLCLRNLYDPIRFVEKYLFLGNNYTEMFGYVQMFFVINYVIYFFDLPKINPKIAKKLSSLAIIIALFFVLALFLRSYDWFYTFSFYFSKLLMVSITLFLYGLGVRFALARNPMAYYYLIGYAPLVYFVGHFILTAAHLTTSKNPLDWEFVTLFEILVLTVAMAHRYYLIIKERDDYQLAVISEQEKGIEAVFFATEEERKRIAKDLHDGVGQQLSALKRGFEELTDRLHKDDKSAAKNIQSLLDQTARETREISHQMMPKSLTELGLLPAMEDALNNAFRPTSISFEFEHFNVKERYSENIELAIFRIFQELVNNIIKHSRATLVNVQLFENQTNLILLVEDNGNGIGDMDKEGIGILNIKSRLSALNGRFNIESEDDSGTAATVVIPCL